MSEVVVIGLGYIGLPTAALIASNRIKVYGVDINPRIVEIINRGEIHIVEPELDEVVKEVVYEGYLSAHLEVKEASVYLIVVPTPFDENHEPDISFVEGAMKSIVPYLKKGDLCIIESTCPVGTTEKMRDYIFSERSDLIDEIHLSYCPERVLPGNVMHELIHNDRVIGGIDEKSTLAALNFYSQFVDGNIHATNAKTAEMCKLVENSSRDVAIAFANELSIICEKADIDVWNLINLANKHPRVNILSPGCGVGGHCIAVDPYFITHQFPKESKIIGTARGVNDYKPFWCLEIIEKTCMQFEIDNGRKAKTAIMGLAFKPDIDDLRESPAEFIANKVVESSNYQKCYIVEPNIDKHDAFTLSNYMEAIEKSDIIIFLVAHNEFKEILISKEKIILDFCGVFK